LWKKKQQMLIGELRGKIDKVWEQFWTGGLSNPITVIEQMTYLLFIRRLDDIHTQREQKASFLKKPIDKPVIISTNLEAYRKRVTEYIQKNKNHITIHKLRTNQAITASELLQLEKMLFEQGELGTHEQFVKAYGEQPLGSFIRSIVGMDQAAANAAFSNFINNPSMNASQIRFVNLIIQYLSTNGVITAEKLFEPPFTEINDAGLLGVFNNKEADSIVKTIEFLNQLALAK